MQKIHEMNVEKYVNMNIMQNIMGKKNFQRGTERNYNFHVHSIGQFIQAGVSLYSVYCWKIIQQRMLVVDNFHIKIPYTNTYFFACF